VQRKQEYLGRILKATGILDAKRRYTAVHRRVAQAVGQGHGDLSAQAGRSMRGRSTGRTPRSGSSSSRRPRRARPGTTPSRGRLRPGTP
jgi:hypothetical protein